MIWQLRRDLEKDKAVKKTASKQNRQRRCEPIKEKFPRCFKRPERILLDTREKNLVGRNTQTRNIIT